MNNMPKKNNMKTLQDRKQSIETLLKQLISTASRLEQQHKEVMTQVFKVEGQLVLLNELIKEQAPEIKDKNNKNDK